MKKLSVLIGEDNELIRSSYVALFQHLGIFASVIEAKDGMEFLYKFDNQDFDMVLIDYNMPRKNGLHCLMKLKERGFNMKNTILCTGEMTELILRQAKAVGCDKLITKPPRRELLEEKIYQIANSFSNMTSPHT